MQKETSKTLYRIAARMRVEAEETMLPEYQSLMLRTAGTLEAEADRLDEILFKTIAPELRLLLH